MQGLHDALLLAWWPARKPLIFVLWTACGLLYPTAVKRPPRGHGAFLSASALHLMNGGRDGGGRCCRLTVPPPLGSRTEYKRSASSTHSTCLGPNLKLSFSGPFSSRRLLHAVFKRLLFVAACQSCSTSGDLLWRMSFFYCTRLHCSFSV